MKSLIFAVVAVIAFLGVCSAFPQSFGIQKTPYYGGRPPVHTLPYRPPSHGGRPPVHTLPYRPPQSHPKVYRVRRQVLGGSLTSNPAGGSDARLELAKGIGSPDHNVIGKVFAAGNTDKGPVTTGGALSYNNHGFGATIAKEHTPGVRDTFSQSVNANLFNNDKHSLTANAFASQNTLANGFKFDRNGVGLDYNHVNGHGAGITHSTIPNFGSQLGLNGKANLWSSQDRNTRLDLTGHGSQWTSGPFKGQRDFGGGIGLTHLFG